MEILQSSARESVIPNHAGNHDILFLFLCNILKLSTMADCKMPILSKFNVLTGDDIAVTKSNLIKPKRAQNICILE